MKSVTIIRQEHPLAHLMPNKQDLGMALGTIAAVSPQVAAALLAADVISLTIHENEEPPSLHVSFIQQDKKEPLLVLCRSLYPNNG